MKRLLSSGLFRFRTDAETPPCRFIFATVRILNYLRSYGEQTARHTEKILGIRRFPTHAARNHRIRDVGSRHARSHAYGRRQIDNLPVADACERGVVHRRNPAYRADERPGGPSATPRDTGCSDTFGSRRTANRHRARQLRIRRREIPLSRTRTSGVRNVPAARTAHERLSAGGRRSRSGATISDRRICESPNCGGSYPTLRYSR